MLKRFLSQDGFDEMLERLKSVIDNLANKLNAHKSDNDVHTTAAEKAKWNSTSSKLTDDVWVDLMNAKNKAHTHDNKDTLDSITNDAWLRAYGMSHEHSNKDTLDRITSQDYADFKGAANKAHVHNNKETLDKIDETAWATVYGQTHEHENKETLDRLTSAVWVDLMNAKNKAHVHDNMDTLDKIDDVSWLKVYGQAHEHDNKDTLDKLTAQDYADFKGTVNKAHTHSNKDTLDNLNSDWWTQWLAAYGNMHTHDNKEVLDQLNQEQWKFLNSAANKAHTHENKDTLDSITSAAWLTVYGQTHEHDNKDVLDKTTASYTAADKAKLDGMDLSKYLPLSGGTMSGNIDMFTNKKDIRIGSQPASIDTVSPVGSGTLTVDNDLTVFTPTKRSFIGTYNLKTNDTWYNLISVRHRNGYGDGSKWGMAIYSNLFGGSLHWNQQTTTSGDTWQGDRTLLDSVNYSSFALSLHGTADKATELVSGAMRYGWCATSDASANSGYRWFCVGKLPKSQLGYLTEILYLNVCGGYGLFGVLRVFVRTDSAGTNVEQMNVTWLTRDTTTSRPQFKLVALETDTGVSFELWCFTTARWQQMFCNVIADLNLTGGLYNRWVLETHSSADAKNATTVGTTSVTDVDMSYANKADTLTDSGWKYSTVGVSGLATSSIKYRKQGKIVCISGNITVSASTASIAPLTLPKGYRPPQTIKIVQTVDNSTQDTYLITIGTDGKVTYSGKKQGFFTTDISYYMHTTFFVD